MQITIQERQLLPTGDVNGQNKQHMKCADIDHHAWLYSAVSSLMGLARLLIFEAVRKAAKQREQAEKARRRSRGPLAVVCGKIMWTTLYRYDMLNRVKISKFL